MAPNLLSCDRDQELLMPPSMREWLPEDHLAWFVIDAVAELYLDPFYAAYRADGHGRAAHDPQMMLALLLYAYCKGERSSRAIEARCREDVAYRVICGGRFPDHATIARFRARHQEALAELFTGVLSLCAEAGLAAVGTVALDSTKVKANASRYETRARESIEREMAEILAEAERVDAAEDERYGERRGDELPPELGDRRSRLERLREAKRRIDAQEARREAEAQERIAERRARHERYRSEGKGIPGRRAMPASKRKRKPTPARANVTDPDSKLAKAPGGGFVQGYSGHAVANERHVIVSAELAEEANDSAQLEPMVAALNRDLEAAGISEPVGTVLADGGYRSGQGIEAVEASGTEVLVAIRSNSHGKRRMQERGELRPPPRPTRGSTRERMAKRLEEEGARRRYLRRGALIEPVFGEIKSNRRCDRFSRRGRAAARSEWRLFAATHNLLRLWRELGRIRAQEPAMVPA